MKAKQLDEWATDTTLLTVGQSSGRVEGPAKVSGRACYSSDVQLPAQLHAAVLRSPHPHAAVLRVDASAAMAIDGVHAVLTAENVDLKWYEEDVPFFSDVVRFVGDEVAAVAAVDARTAERALEAIIVDYDVRNHVTDFEAVADGVNAGGGLWESPEPTITERGSVDGAARAAVTVAREYRTPTAIHHALESHGCVAQWIDDRLTLYVSTQGVNDVREKVAKLFELDHNQVRVVAEHVGGGFGAKQIPWKNTVIAALLARNTGRPVRLVLDRRAESLAAGKRGATRQRVRLAASDVGELISIEVEAVADGGAYRLGGESADLSGPYLHLYKCPNVRVSMRTVYTNTGPAVAFRAPGYVEATFALESAMDELAQLVGVDPVELRRRNYTTRNQQDSLPWSSPEALKVSYDRVVRVADWPTPVSSDDPEIAVGRGFAAHEWMAASATPPGYAWIELNADGSIHATTSVQDIGTGTRTALAQVVAEALAADPTRVRLTLGDTAAGPPAPASAGSTTMPTMAPALRAAAVDLRGQLLAEAASHLNLPVVGLELGGEEITDPGSGRVIGLGDLLEAIAPKVLRGQGGRTETTDEVSVRTFGSAVADVAVNTRTGEIRVSRVVVAPDCGRIVNPLLANSQVIGGVTQGIGFALTEQQIIDHHLGIVLNPNLEDYLVPTAADSCRIDHAVVGIPDLAANGIGVKGLGELPMIAVPAAIANAVADATGVRPDRLPITAMAIVEALARRTEPKDAG